VAREIQFVTVTNTSATSDVNVSMNGRSTVISSLSDASTVQAAIESLFDAPCTIQQDSSIEFYGADCPGALLSAFATYGYAWHSMLSTAPGAPPPPHPRIHAVRNRTV
jgi:hypothetical protein